MARVVLIEAVPWDIAGADVNVYLAGGGARGYDHRGRTSWIGGLVKEPKFASLAGFDENGFTGAAVPQASKLGWFPNDKAALSSIASRQWIGAPITVYVGDDATAAPVWTVLLTGTVTAAPISDGAVNFTIADLGKKLDDAFLTARFGGTGGIDGDAAAEARIKRRTFGKAFNIEGRTLLKAYNIFEFGDPAFPLNAFTALRDMGRVAAPAPTVLAWQGSIAATVAALQAAACADGSGVVAPSIACAKWWTQPSGPLTADIQGEVGVGYVNKAADIASRIAGAVAGGPGMTAGTVAAINAVRADECGVHIGDESESASSALDRLLLPCSILWAVEAAGTITLNPIAFANPVETITVQTIERQEQFKPTISRKLAYQRSHRKHSDGEISAAVLHADVEGLGDLALLSTVKLGGTGQVVESDGFTPVTDASALNRVVTLSAGGALAGAGGGQVTLPGLGAGSVAYASDIGGGNLVKNSSFETDTNNDGLASGFLGYSNDGNAITTTRVTGRTGGLAQRVAWAANTAEKGIYIGSSDGIDNSSLWRQNQTHIWSVYAKASGAAIGAILGMAWNNAPFSATAISNPALSANWQRYIFKIVWTTGALDVNGFWSIAHGAGNGVSSIDFDDIQLEYGDVVTAYAPRANELLPGVVTATILATNAAQLGLNVVRSTGGPAITDAEALNSAVSISAGGALSGAGGGQVTFGGLGGGAVGLLADITLGGTALLKNETGAQLTVAQVRNAYQDGSVTHVLAPAGGSFWAAGTSTGAIRIKLPVGYTDTMIRFVVDIFQYDQAKASTYIISGYTYAGGSYWVNVSAQMTGDVSQSFAVDFGDSGGKACVWIGVAATTWQFLSVRIRDLQVSYVAYSVASWETGWNVAVDIGAHAATGAGGVVQIAKPTPGPAILSNNQYDSGGNQLTATGTHGVKNSGLSLSAAGAFSGGGGGQILYDSLADGSTYAKVAAAELSSGVPKLSVAGSGKRLADPRNMPAIAAMNLGSKFTGAISYTSASGTPATATISIAAGSMLIGSQSISYNALSVGVTGTGGTTVTFYLYGDDPTFAGGSPTLVATTTASVIYQNDGRVYFGYCDVFFPASGTGGGGGVGGGGQCVAGDAWVETLDRGFVRARDIVEGDLLRVLTADRESTEWIACEGNRWSPARAYRITAASGIEVELSEATPITLRDGSIIRVGDIDGHALPVIDEAGFRWEACHAEPIGNIQVAHIRVQQRTYAAGSVAGRSICTHNPKP